MSGFTVDTSSSLKFCFSFKIDKKNYWVGGKQQTKIFLRLAPVHVYFIHSFFSAFRIKQHNVQIARNKNNSEKLELLTGTVNLPTKIHTLTVNILKIRTVKS